MDAAGDSVVKASKGGIRVGVDREMFGDGVGVRVQQTGMAGEGAEDGERVLGIGSDVGVQKDKHVGKKVRQGLLCCAVPLGRREIEHDGEMRRSVHNPSINLIA